MHAHAKKLLALAPPEAAEWRIAEWAKWCEQIAANPRHEGFRYLAYWHKDQSDMARMLKSFYEVDG
ncbi:MAG: hypothetical protein JSR80_01625 [Verrucomicrobia bacterium]|nr:hypothetical protein [Verrucomicrobiota bacterium]